MPTRSPLGELSDRIARPRPDPRRLAENDFQPSRDERIALQRKLADLGFKVADFNGHIDFDLRDNIRKWSSGSA